MHCMVCMVLVPFWSPVVESLTRESGLGLFLALSQQRQRDIAIDVGLEADSNSNVK